MKVTSPEMLAIAISVLRKETAPNPFYAGVADDAEKVLIWHLAGAIWPAPAPFSGAHNPLRTALSNVCSELAISHWQVLTRKPPTRLSTRKASAELLGIGLPDFAAITSNAFYRVASNKKRFVVTDTVVQEHLREENT